MNRKISEIFRRLKTGNVRVLSNPEFLREGSAIDDFMKPDRVTTRIQDEESRKVMAEIYKPLYLRDFPLIFTDCTSAEIIKYASNAFLQRKFPLSTKSHIYVKK